ncbi:MAG: hypothetical protein QW666_00670 [Candidatus Woesearchaeota archaeon]
MVGTTSTTKKAGIGILIFAIIVHTLDAFFRLTPGGRINYTLWTIFFIFYAVLAVTGARKFETWQGPLIASGLAFFVIPFVYAYIAKSVALLVLILLLAPTWVIYLLVFQSEHFPRISWVYMIFWLIFLLFSLMPRVQDFASAQGYSLPAVSPGIAIRYFANTIYEGTVKTYRLVFITAPKTIKRDIEKTIRTASGDYYTGTVDQSAEKITGVYVQDLKAVQAEFFEGRPVTVRGKIKAATIAQPINIHLSCVAEPGSIKAKSIEPDQDITVVGSIEKPIACIFEGLSAKYYTIKLTADFNFATRAYQKTYFMDNKILNEYLIRNEDPLEGFPDKKPTTKHSPGPLMIGMTESFPTQPTGITQGKSGPIIGITIDNLWSGKIKEVKELVIYTPKGLEIKDINGVAPERIRCADLHKEEQVGCDTGLENIYRVPKEYMQKLSKTTVHTYDVHTNVTDSGALLGNAPISVRNIKVTAEYDYTYTLELGVSVKSTPIS